MTRKPYLIFTGDVSAILAAKTAFGVRRWAPTDCVGQWRFGATGVELGLPRMGPKEAARAGAKSLLIGVSPVGGALPPHWVASLEEALEAGLDIVSGLHARLAEYPTLAQAARKHGRSLHDIRYNNSRGFDVATGSRRSGKRLLTVGTDCAVGKKYTALVISQEMQRRGVDAMFRATGQTGILIAGEGIAIDAVVSDFVAGAAEALSPAAADDHWDVIEGQGAIFHPAYAGVMLSLLHGSQPDALVLCHDPMRKYLSYFPNFPIAPLSETMEMYVSLARVTNPAARFDAISLNTATMAEAEAVGIATMLEDRHGIPCFDPLRFGSERATKHILSHGDGSSSDTDVAFTTGSSVPTPARSS